jgi:arginine decarboxylase
MADDSIENRSSWSVEQSKTLYGVDYWGAGYFSINDRGHIEVTPQGPNGAKIDLYQLTQDLTDRGLRLPILVRFTDIIKSRIQLLHECFDKAIRDYGYKGLYQGVYPIKVNQQRQLVQDIVELGRPYRLGLECGSKPELLITLALMDTPDALIICNGFKDREYIETAMLSRKLGRNTYIVVDRMDEIGLIIQAYKQLGIRPKIGIRAKLNTQGSGKWMESAGARSKFGLTPSEIVHALKTLGDEGLLDCLDMIHFHVGSQIPSIQSIKSTIKEGVRFYTELYRLGASPRYIDVGGGLGVNYDGTGRTDNSTDYSEQEYANDVVTIIQSICDEKGVPHPNIVTESGRSLVAHSSVLIFNVLGRNEIKKDSIDFSVNGKDSRLVQEMFDIYTSLNTKNINEYYNDLVEKKRDMLNLFKYGVLDLEQRAKAEDLYWATASRMLHVAQQAEDSEGLYRDLEKELSDSYFCNFSLFQSIPDAWALDQVFPVAPIHRLTEDPERSAVLVDLTCDSDGKMCEFIDPDGDKPQKYIKVHKLIAGQEYYLATFLTGAYQEILGDLHNLFGDTDIAHVTVEDSHYEIDHVVRGDSVTEVLEYVEYSRAELVEKIRRSAESGIRLGLVNHQEAKLLLEHYEQGLAGYTYFEEATY